MKKTKKYVSEKIKVEITCVTCGKTHVFEVWGKNKIWNRVDQLFFSFSHEEKYLENIYKNE